jgi:hypothetical protein
MGIISHQRRLKRLEGAAKRHLEIVVIIIDGVDDPDEVLARTIASGKIAEHQRADVRFIRRVIVEPIWDMRPDGSARLVGRRNVHTGEVEKVELGSP